MWLQYLAGKVWTPFGLPNTVGVPRMSELANPVDRQRHPRHSTMCPGTLFSGDQSVECQVLNISAGGAKIRLAEPVPTDALVRVRIERIGEFTARIAWRNGETIGVEFQDDLAEVARIVEDVLRHDTTRHDRRGDARASVLWSGKLRSAGQIATCRIVNISLKGAQLLSDKPIDCGLEVILWIERFGEFNTTLVWQDGSMIGVQFVDPPRTIERRFGDSLPALR